ncbi:hypothetical protein LOZ07_003532 [Ophidiomyces ophidiicola]|uniref:uncharacterized protein n=1 Tax=Ophidiomyces ophidiicola TaxID=1387563 RepID=UPI0020C3F569|nr:uncharacterized protein LOZ57_003042 [Ophidiomyces ophidiicola]KAI1947891.1 hypothetical protein LOZ57_003042 [Ophidiomyces ophidiicola]KAI1956035.1 hypothetical protein LOZ62_000026 [Ophidiomyces ophidiicola]KAI2018825.1 hypothetical protein LOZ45_005783 [Ophidiomyces ophidiicola]KAI2024998.1 hypothetical protein LOZ46_000751 [Ophidiomyces ophidiicola]KAI2028260.1 hypothetical protein LOZ48_004335 [Ophidiomyces ophidiicola]
MASIRFSSSISSPIRRTGSISSLHARCSSFSISYQFPGIQLSQVHTQSQLTKSPRPPTSKPRSTKSRAPKSKITRPKTVLSAEETTPALALPLTNLPYFIRRTSSNQFPVYLEKRAGGTKLETRLQKTEGDVDALREDLIKALGMDENPADDVKINRLNGHILVNGWRKAEILQFLQDRKF